MTIKSSTAVIVFGIVTASLGLFSLTEHFGKGMWFLILFDCLFILLAIGVLNLKSWARVILLFFSWLIVVGVPLTFIAMIIPAIASQKSITTIISFYVHQFSLSLLYSIAGISLLTRPNIKKQFK